MHTRAEPEPNLLSRLVAIVLWAPLVWLATFAALVVRARLHLGEWPVGYSGSPFHSSYVRSNIDPGTFELHCGAVWIGLFGLHLLMPLGILVLVVSPFVRGVRPHPSAAVGFLVGGGSIAVLLGMDPGGYFNLLRD
jgi:hypothetical protein